MHEAIQRYADSHNEFSSLLAYAVSLIEAQRGHEPRGEQQYYGERIFGKLVCHGLSLKALSPSPPPTKSGELWDVSSNYALARTLIETYDALAYVAFESLSAVEREFRLLLWQLHSVERRAEMLRLIGSKDPKVADVQSDLIRLKSSLLGHSLLPSAGEELRKKIERGETPPYHLSQRERDQRLGVDRDYHRAVVMHLSAHVHTHPFSVYQLFEFQAGDPECFRLMAVPLQYSAGFLSKAIVGMIELFQPRTPPVGAPLQRTMDLWNNLLAKGVAGDG
jgi:hypothetical protein